MIIAKLGYQRVNVKQQNIAVFVFYMGRTAHLYVTQYFVQSIKHLLR